MWTVAPLIVLFCLGAAFFVLDRRMTPKAPKPPAAALFPAQQYAQLPDEDREFVLDNLRLAGVRVDGPPGVLRLGPAQPLPKPRVLLRCAVCDTIDDLPKRHDFVSRDGQPGWRTVHRACAGSVEPL